MKIVLLSGSNVGSKTRIAMDQVKQTLTEKNPEHEVSLLDLKEYKMEFSDGRNYLDYKGDTGYVVTQLMAADVIIIGSPIFQASIPASLKNIFDLLPQNALLNKTVSMVITAGSPKHFLIAEQQLKPILGYMKANVVQNYVFIEEIDFFQGKIINDDVLFRIEKLVEDTIILAATYQQILAEHEDQYGF